jgi:hypothetical protein
MEKSHILSVRVQVRGQSTWVRRSLSLLSPASSLMSSPSEPPEPDLLDTFPTLSEHQALVALAPGTGEVWPVIVGLPDLDADVEYRPEATVFLVQGEMDARPWPLLTLTIDLIGTERVIQFSVGPSRLWWAEAVLERGGINFDNADGTAVFLTTADIQGAVEAFCQQVVSYLGTRT